MINKVLLSMILVFATSLNANQTFEQSTANKAKYFYGVTYTLNLVENGVPSDYYVSELDVISNTWTPISNTFGWGNFDQDINVSFTPNKIYSNGKLGIHTGNRNSGTFSTLPTDTTDILFDIEYASGTFTNLDNIWYDDIFYLIWDVDPTTTPERVELQYKLSSSTWTKLGMVNVADGTIAIHNEFAMESVKFRLAYEGINYSIAKTNQIPFLNAELSIPNKSTVESIIYKDSEVVSIELLPNRISEYTKIIVYKNGTPYTELKYNTTSFSYSADAFLDAVAYLEFYTEWGYKLNDITITSRYKWFEIAPIGSNYIHKDVIDFAWSYSDNFRYVDILLKKNSETIYKQINSNWLLSNRYKYIVNELDSNLQFKFIVRDDHNTLTTETSVIYINSLCNEDSLYAIIDSLRAIKPEIILSILIKDVPLNVEIKSEYDVRSMVNYTDIQNGTLILNEINTISHVYISNYIGQVIYNSSGNGIKSNIDISNYNNGLYFITIIGFNDKISVYKFIK